MATAERVAIRQAKAAEDAAAAQRGTDRKLKGLQDDMTVLTATVSEMDAKLEKALDLIAKLADGKK